MGKTAVQLAHAAILAYERADKRNRKMWMKNGQKKVALKVADLKELYEMRDRAEGMGLPRALVVDAGLTEIPPGTVTALGVGPASSVELDKLFGELKLL